MAEATALDIAPGVVASDVLYPLANAACRRAGNAYANLKEQMRPLTIGVEWASAQAQLLSWSSTHIEDAIRAAVRHVSGFSVVQLEAAFGPRSTMWQHVGRRLLSRVSGSLLVGRDGGVENLVATTLVFALPLLREHRARLGLSDTVRSNPVAELLRMHPVVRRWTPDDGPLMLTVAQLQKEGPPELRSALDVLCSKSSLVSYRRRTGDSCFRYYFRLDDLRRVLSV